MALIDKFGKYYTITVICTNCQTMQELKILKGITIKDFLDESRGKCARCGCDTLETLKDNKTKKVVWK